MFIIYVCLGKEKKTSRTKKLNKTKKKCNWEGWWANTNIRNMAEAL